MLDTSKLVKVVMEDHEEGRTPFRPALPLKSIDIMEVMPYPHSSGSEPLRPGNEQTFKTVKEDNPDQDEGKDPLNPLLHRDSSLRLLMRPNTSRGPLRLASWLKSRLVRDVMLDHDTGTGPLRLGRELARRS